MTAPADPFVELESSKRALRDGLTLLDRSASGDTDQDDAGRLAAWKKVMASLRAAPAPEELRASVPADRLEAFDDELEELLRLNAVLVSVVSSEKDQVLGKLRKVREARRGMAYYGSASPEGDRCDISG
ncbi:hypothetical protein Poly30_05070 [Planctomycetes bacterium Poly30]|uniref:FlgN protein n=1 Tax=Saltatorellus ferox TaxID=2528018 RepID=A0A518ELQ8_9BACT|nr:hypothetical protein Poly30_05070 [Planctomycetes bacterium Poly30]